MPRPDRHPKHRRSAALRLQRGKGASRHAPPPPPKSPASPEPPRDTHWDAVAGWYDALVGEAGSEYHRKVVIPGVLKLLDLDPTPTPVLRSRRQPAPKGRVLSETEPPRILDLACGQGVLCRALAHHGCKVLGIDAAHGLVSAARQRNEEDRLPLRYEVADVSKLEVVTDLTDLHGTFDAAACVLAIQNIAVLSPVWRGARLMLKPGGRLIAVMMHPCFRVPKASSWGWDASGFHAGPEPAARAADEGPGASRTASAPRASKPTGTQYRRIDRYLSSTKTPIQMHPGSDPSLTTLTFHRPLQAYVNTLAESGFLIDRLEEWPSHKKSDRTDPKAPAQDFARREIPMFLALRAVAV